MPPFIASFSTHINHHLPSIILHLHPSTSIYHLIMPCLIMPSHLLCGPLPIPHLHAAPMSMPLDPTPMPDEINPMHLSGHARIYAPRRYKCT